MLPVVVSVRRGRIRGQAFISMGKAQFLGSFCMVPGDRTIL